MRAWVAFGWIVLAAAGCGSAAAGTSSAGGTSSSSGGDACSNPFLEVMGDGLPQKYTITKANEVAGTLVLGGSADSPSDATISITSDELGSTSTGHVDYHHGMEQLSGDQATVTITELGAVGEAIEGSYAATVAPVTVGITLSLSGDFKLCRGADGAM